MLTCTWCILVLLSLLVLCNAECSNVCDIQPLTCNYISYPIYTTNLNLTQAEQNVTNIMKTANNVKVLLPKCYAAVQLFACTYFYPSCDGDGKPLKPCKDTCTVARTECDAVFNLLTPEQQEMLNCESSHFEQSNTNCARLNSTQPAPCNNTNPVQKGACYPYDPTAASKTSKICSPFVSKQIYLLTNNATEEQGTIDTSLFEIVGLAEKLFPLTPIQCYQSVLSLMCRSFFPTCNTESDPYAENNTIYVSSLPCRSMCESTNDLCGSFFDLVNQTKFNCSAPFLGYIPWEEGPTYKTTTNSESKLIETTCQTGRFPADPYASFAFPVVDECPFPLARNPNPDGNERTCWIPCPDPTYTHSQWTTLIVLGEVCASISFVVTLFLLVNSLLDAQRRRFPANLHIYEFASAALLPISFFINGSNPREEVWCDDAVSYASIKTNLKCGVQGYIFIFTILSIMMWWLVLSVNTFIAVVLGQRNRLQSYRTFYHLIGFGVPFTLTTTIAAKGSIGYVPPASWCFITANGFNVQRSDNTSIGFDYYMFYIPIGIAILLASAMFGAVLVTLYKARRSALALTGTSAVTLRTQTRIIIFVAVLLILFVLIFEWRFVLQAGDPDEIKKVDLEWSVCKIKQQLGIDNAGHCPGTTLPRQFNFDHTAFETFLASSMGIFLFLVFGTDPSIYARWRLILQLLWDERWKELGSLIKENKQPLASNTSQTINTKNKTQKSDLSSSSEISLSAMSSEQVSPAEVSLHIHGESSAGSSN